MQMRSAADGGQIPAWVPDAARHYLEHTEEGLSLRALARRAGCHPSTVMRQVRRFENRRDDPLIDEVLATLARRQPPSGTPQRKDLPVNTQISQPMSARPMAGQAGRMAKTVGAPVPRAGDGPRALVARAEMPCKTQTANGARDHGLADTATIAREARRVLRRLAEPGAVLAVAPDLDKAAVLREGPGGGSLRTAVVDRSVAQAFALQDWIACRRPGRVASYEITSAGRAALRRMLEEDAGGHHGGAGHPTGLAEAPQAFADQHRLWGERSVIEPGEEAPRRLRVNLAESPVAVLGRRRDKDGKPFLSPDLVAAAERLRQDFEIAQMGPRVTQNWERFLTGGDRGGFPPAGEGGAGNGPRAARDRVAAALRDLGPGLADMALRCCCFLDGLETAERRLGWSARSGKIVLRIALMRLRRHYDEAYGGAEPLIG